MFEPGRVHVRFVVDEVAVTQVFLRVLSLSLVIVISPYSALIFVYTSLLPGRRTGGDWELYRSSVLSEIGERWIDKYLVFKS